ncbi:MAG: ABC transporter permease [Dermabacteraceae bacterium]
MTSLQTLTSDRVPNPGRTRARARRLPPLRLTVVLSGLVLLLAITWALVPGLFTSYGPTASVGPSLQAPSADHWFGTDATGRDVFSRVVHGASHSLTAALVAVAVGLVVGTMIGVIAGSVGGLVEDALMRVVDVLLAIPGLLLSLSVVILLGFGTTNAAIAVGVTSIATFARLSRSRVLEVRRSEYVEAAFGSGGTLPAILWRHILPNSAAAVIALAALQLGSAILQISTLGFLGYGAPPPTPEWGLLIAEGRDYVATAWWLTLLPGLVVAAVVLSTNRLSDAIGKVELS